MEIATGAFPIPPENLTSIFELLQFIEDEPSPKLPAGQFSSDFQDFISYW